MQHRQGCSLFLLHHTSNQGPSICCLTSALQKSINQKSHPATHNSTVHQTHCISTQYSNKHLSTCMMLPLETTKQCSNNRCTKSLSQPKGVGSTYYNLHTILIPKSTCLLIIYLTTNSSHKFSWSSISWSLLLCNPYQSKSPFWLPSNRTLQLHWILGQEQGNHMIIIICPQMQQL